MAGINGVYFFQIDADRERTCGQGSAGHLHEKFQPFLETSIHRCTVGLFWRPPSIDVTFTFLHTYNTPTKGDVAEKYILWDSGGSKIGGERNIGGAPNSGLGGGRQGPTQKFINRHPCLVCMEGGYFVIIFSGLPAARRPPRPSVPCLSGALPLTRRSPRHSMPL